jgi:hypothetical protein
MGFVEVKLTDTSGKALQLKGGSLATLTMPASSNAANAADIPLWYYDEAAGIWKREGNATRQADGTYQGTVKHFTIWYADFKGVTATIKGCFVDAAGSFTGAAGSTTVYTVPGLVFVPPIVVPPTPTGNVAVYAADYTGTYSGAEAGTFSVRANTTGVITGTVFSQTFGQSFPVNGQVSNSGGVTLSTGGTAGSAQFSGSINAAGVISGKWNYFGVTTGGTFTKTSATMLS